MTLAYPVSGLRISADFSALDDLFVANAVKLTELGAGNYQLRYPVSKKNQRAPGRHAVKVTAKAANGESSSTSFELGLRAAPIMPVVIE